MFCNPNQGREVEREEKGLALAIYLSPLLSSCHLNLRLGRITHVK